MRDMSDKNILDEFCIKFCSIVEKHCKYIIVSGFVAISSGRVRATEDIDMIIERLSFEKYKQLHDDLVKAGFVCMQSGKAEESYGYLKGSLAIRYTIKDKPLPNMEVKFAKDELDTYQINTRKKLPLTGLDVWFSSINMNIAFKEELLKSDKDMKDAEHLRKIYPEKVEENEIHKIKKMIKRLRS
ncbi:hypothetical protein JW930_05900 [Candidatus Woesearchaeota archaeon]|nr:hypothetical protein [Candidatus Woesearchaeota archaeon]